MQEQKDEALNEECKSHLNQNKEQVERYWHEACIEGRRVKLSEQMQKLREQEKEKEELEKTAKAQEEEYARIF